MKHQKREAGSLCYWISPRRQTVVTAVLKSVRDVWRNALKPNTSVSCETAVQPTLQHGTKARCSDVKTLVLLLFRFLACNRSFNLSWADYLLSPYVPSTSSVTFNVYFQQTGNRVLCFVYSCLLYIGHRSAEYSCHTHSFISDYFCLFLLSSAFLFLVALSFQWMPVTSLWTTLCYSCCLRWLSPLSLSVTL